MNEQAKEVLAQLMQRALDGVDAAVEFSKQQLPDVVQQLLIWKSMESFIFFALGLVFLASGIISFRKLNPSRESRKQRILDARAAYERGESWTRFKGSGPVTSIEFDRIVRGDEGDEFVRWACLVVGILSGSLFTISNLTWLKIWLAPKLYLLEYGASLIK